MHDEPFDPGRFLKGFINPAMLWKTLPLMFWIVLVLLFIYGSILAGAKIKSLFFKTPLSPQTIGAISGGEVDASSGKSSKIGINLF